MWSAQIADATAEAEAAFDDAVSTTRWQRAMETLTEDLTLARANAAG